MGGIDLPLDPVVRTTVAKFFDRFTVEDFCAIQLSTAEQYGAQAACLRTVRVFRSLTARMVFAMNGRPFAGDHSGGHPKPESEEMADDGMQVQGPVGLTAMQIDRHRRNRDLGQNQCDHTKLPPGQIKKATIDPVKKDRVHPFETHSIS